MLHYAPRCSDVQMFRRCATTPRCDGCDAHPRRPSHGPSLASLALELRPGLSFSLFLRCSAPGAPACLCVCPCRGLCHLHSHQCCRCCDRERAGEREFRSADPEDREEPVDAEPELEAGSEVVAEGEDGAKLASRSHAPRAMSCSTPATPAPAPAPA